ncbi:hypothetical protein ACH5RR_029513 [Cinchona calisaya]|uniref:Uncharacterized protein n=1 Tax=Cinchona calisaya TaxID=153742 RepID=A0ABD2YV59_9GENT
MLKPYSTSFPKALDVLKFAPVSWDGIMHLTRHFRKWWTEMLRLKCWEQCREEWIEYKEICCTEKGENNYEPEHNQDELVEALVDANTMKMELAVQVENIKRKTGIGVIVSDSRSVIKFA